jgi:hypothetical protein
MATVVYTTGPIENFVLNRSNTLVVKLRNGNQSIFGALVTVTLFSVLGTITPVNSQIVTVFANTAMNVNFGQFIAIPAEYEVVVQVFNLPPALPSDVLVGVYGVDIFGNLNPGHRVLHSEMQVIGFTP